jgi:hypothetical protein
MALDPKINYFLSGRSEMAQQIIWGCVNKDATIHSGTGFTPVDSGTGFYDVVFKVPFLTTPSVVTLQNFSDWTNWTYDNGNTRDNTVLIGVDRTKFKVATGNGDGKRTDRNFCFIAVGEV